MRAPVSTLMRTSRRLNGSSAYRESIIAVVAIEHESFHRAHFTCGAHEDILDIRRAIPWRSGVREHCQAARGKCLPRHVPLMYRCVPSVPSAPTPGAKSPGARNGIPPTVAPGGKKHGARLGIASAGLSVGGVMPGATVPSGSIIHIAPNPESLIT